MKLSRLHNFSILAAFLFILLSGCIVHRIDIQQGNVLTQKQISQLKKGMSKRDVRYLLGTPLVVDPFHADRWDYYYSLQEGRKKDVQQRRITVIFVNDQLDSIGGDVASEASLANDAEGDEKQASGASVDKPTQQEKGFFKRTWDKIKE